MVGLYIKRILTINIYILTFKLDELFYLFYISDFSYFRFTFFDPLSAFVIYRGVSSKSYNGFYIVLLAPRVLLWLQQSLRFGEPIVTPLSRGKTNCYRTLWRIDLNLISMTNLFMINTCGSFQVRFTMTKSHMIEDLY